MGGGNWSMLIYQLIDSVLNNLTFFSLHRASRLLQPSIARDVRFNLDFLSIARKQLSRSE